MTSFVLSRMMNKLNQIIRFCAICIALAVNFYFINWLILTDFGKVASCPFTNNKYEDSKKEIKFIPDCRNLLSGKR